MKPIGWIQPAVADALERGITCSAIISPVEMVGMVPMYAETCESERDALRKIIYSNTDREMVMDHRFFVAQKGGFIGDENFDFDAGMRISGDFESDDEREKYALMICCTLNNAVKAIAERDASETAWRQLDDERVEYINLIGDILGQTGEDSLEDTARRVVQERDALAMQVSQMRDVLLDVKPFVSSDKEYNLVADVLAIPDLHTEVIAKHDAAVLRKASKWFGDYYTEDDPVVFRLINMAEELEQTK